MTSRFCFALLAGCAVCCGLAATASAQTASIVGVGQLPGGTDTVCNAVSPDGSVAVGQATVGTSTQAFLWTATGGIKALPFLAATGVDVDSATSTVYVAGNGLNGSVQQALYWVGDTSGVGTATFINLLTGGTTSSAAAIKLHGGAIYVVGQSNKTGNITHAFRWRSSDGDLEDLGDVTGGQDQSSAADVGFNSFGDTIVVGVSQSNWGGATGSTQEAFRWNSSEASLYGMLGIKGLDYVCGRGFQVAAGPNGIAETSADSSSDDLQVVPVGTTGLSSDTVIVTSGTDRICQTINMGSQVAGDDLSWPVGTNADASSQSRARSVSADGRFTVGRSTYRPTSGNWANRPWQATLHDLQVLDGESKSGHNHCEGPPIQFGLGFIDTDNYGEALHVSMPTVPDGQPNYHRQGMAVVGWSNYIQPDNWSIQTDPRAMIAFVSDPAVYDVFTFSKDTRNLKTLLTEQGASLTSWSTLNKATGISDDGHFAVGYGLHNGVKEGFVSYVYNPTATGACCDLTTLTCTDTLPINCTGEFKGMGTVCTGPNAVTCCHLPQADFNGDHFVDMDDFAKLQNCLTVGMATPTIAPECTCMNLSGDNQISVTDIDLFAKCATGSNVMWVSTPDCLK